MTIGSLLWKFKTPIAFFVLLGVIGVLLTLNKSKDTHIDNLSTSMASAGTNYENLKLTNGELKDELKKGKSEYRVIDSLLKVEKAKPGRVSTVYVTKTKIQNGDTVYVTDTTYLDRKGLIKVPFKDSRNCISIEGFVMSTDSFPSVAITSQLAEVDTYDVLIKRKCFLFFWQPKEKRITYTKCGNMQVIRMEKK